MPGLTFWFFSNLVDNISCKCLFDFKYEVLVIMETVGFPFDNFNFVVYSFKFSCI